MIDSAACARAYANAGRMQGAVLTKPHANIEAVVVRYRCAGCVAVGQ
jgi:hypothetical protein